MDSMQINQINPQSSTIVQEIMNNHLAIKGKLFRKILAHKLSKVFKVEESDSLAISRAAEMIHNASLIHDDVVDQADTRRNHPTLNQKMPNSKAVLAGDYLLASVIAELVEIEKYEILKSLSYALQEMVEGEFLQDVLKNKDYITEQDLTQVSHKKTGALIAWICESIALTGKKENEIQALCYQLGLKIGLAFQMYDDTLDYSRESGKEYAKDLKEGLINFTTLNLVAIFPELFYPVLQMRNIKDRSYPWTNEQLMIAVQKTKEDIKKIYTEVYSLFETICEMGHIDKDNAESIEFISFIKDSEHRIN